MKTTVLEIRDKGTRIDALALQMVGDNAMQQVYFRAAGYPEPPRPASIMLMVLYTGRATNDPYEWESLGLGPRTMPVAHKWIIDHYDELVDGQVVDVEFILGETAKSKEPERVQAPFCGECHVSKNLFGRWVLLTVDGRLAWSGAQWVPITLTWLLPAGRFQVCNFETREQAAEYAEANGLVVTERERV